jgi:hypothetical protein
MFHFASVPYLYAIILLLLVYCCHGDLIKSQTVDESNMPNICDDRLIITVNRSNIQLTPKLNDITNAGEAKHSSYNAAPQRGK